METTFADVTNHVSTQNDDARDGNSSSQADCLPPLVPLFLIKQDDDSHGASASSATGRWTHEEHAMFEEGLRRHGKDWKEIAAMIPTRTVIQIRTHAQKYFLRQGKTANGSSHQRVDESQTGAATVAHGPGAWGGSAGVGGGEHGVRADMSQTTTTTSHGLLDTSMALPTSMLPRSASTTSLSSSAMVLSMPHGGEGEHEGGDGNTGMGQGSGDAFMDHTEAQRKGEGSSARAGKGSSHNSSSSSSASSSSGGAGLTRPVRAYSSGTLAGLGGRGLGSPSFHPGRGLALPSGDLDSLDGSGGPWYRPASSSAGPLEDAELDLALAKMGLASPASTAAAGQGEAPPWLSPVTGALPHPPASSMPGYLLPAGAGGGGESASPKRARRVVSDPLPLSLGEAFRVQQRIQVPPTSGSDDEDGEEAEEGGVSSGSGSRPRPSSISLGGGRAGTPSGVVAVTEADRELAGMVAQTSLLLGASGRVSPTPTAMASALPHLTRGASSGSLPLPLSRPGSFRGDASLAALIAANLTGSGVSSGSGAGNSSSSSSSSGGGAGSGVPPSPIHRSGSFRSPALSGTSSPLTGVKRALPLPGGLEDLPSPMPATTTVIGPNGPMVLSLHGHGHGVISPGSSVPGSARSPIVSWGKSSSAPAVSSSLALGPPATSLAHAGSGLGGGLSHGHTMGTDTSFARPASTTSLSTTMSGGSQATRASAGVGAGSWEGGTVGSRSINSHSPSHPPPVGGQPEPQAQARGMQQQGGTSTLLGMLHRPHPSSPAAYAAAPWGASSVAVPLPAAPKAQHGPVRKPAPMGFVAQPAAGFE